jgi:serine protease Do
MIKSTLRTTLVASAIALMSTIAVPAQAGVPPESFADLVEKVQPAVVNISTTTQVKISRTQQGFPSLPPGHPLEQFFKGLPQERGAPEPRRPGGKQDDTDENGDKVPTREARSLGSGFIIDPAGYIVTNNHVISADDGDQVVDKIQIVLNGNEKFEAKLIGRDVASDLAVLKIEAKRPLPFVKFGSSDTIRVGDWAIAVGNPFGVGQSVTAGIISGLHRDVVGAQYPFFIQTDASINRGNSGGPMFNSKGDVIGINTAIYSPSGGNVGIGFSIPSTYALKIVEQLKTQGRVKRGYLGVNIQSLDDDTAAGLGLKDSDGAAIVNVNPNTPASKAGLKVGDIILAFNGKKISNSRELSLAVSETGIGTSSDVDIIRDSKPLRIKVQVGDLPGGDPALLASGGAEKPKTPKPTQSTATRQSLGITLTPLTPDARKQLELPNDISGVIIASISQNSDAAEKGLQPGDLIIAIGGASVASPEQAGAAVDGARKAGKEIVTLTIRRGDNTFFRGVKLQPAR